MWENKNWPIHLPNFEPKLDPDILIPLIKSSYQFQSFCYFFFFRNFCKTWQLKRNTTWAYILPTKLVWKGVIPLPEGDWKCDQFSRNAPPQYLMTTEYTPPPPRETYYQNRRVYYTIFLHTACCFGNHYGISLVYWTRFVKTHCVLFTSRYKRGRGL